MSSERYTYYFRSDRPAFVDGLLARKHRRLYELAVADGSVRSVLEVGPGEGWFARVCRDAGVGYRALEATAIGTERLRAHGFAVRQATIPPLPPDEEPVDLLYASHVIEHLPGPDAVLAFLDDCRAALAPEGRLVLVFPDAKRFGVHFWESDYTHTWPSTPRRVAQVATDAGYEVTTSHRLCLHATGWRADLLYTAARLYPHWVLARMAPARAELLYRVRLLLSPDSLMVLMPR